MTLDQLKHFVTAAKLQNLTQAADTLYLSRSAISRSIAALEQEFDTPLLIRSSRSVSCTRAGELLKLRAELLLAEAESIQRDVSALAHSGQTDLCIACSFPMNKDFLNVMEAFQAAYPEIVQTFYSVTPGQAFHDLCNSRCDIAISFSYAQPSHIDGLRWITIDHGNFRLLTSVRSPLASRLAIPFEEAKRISEPLPFCAEEKFGRIADTGNKFGPKDTKNAECSLEALLLPVQLNQVNIVVPEHVCGLVGDLCASIPVTGCDTAYDVNVCYINSNPNPGVDAFMSMLKRC